MKYIKRFENKIDQTKKDVENSKKFILILYYGKIIKFHEIIEIKHIRENDVEVYYQEEDDNGNFTKSDFLDYQKFIVLDSFDTFEEALELKNNINKYNL